jgi:transcriptional regulator with XRE-family HTH domain
MRRFGEKLRHLRTQRGLTMQQLADALGYGSSGYVSDVETGKREPTLKFVLKVADLFDASLDQLLRDTIELELPPDE